LPILAREKQPISWSAYCASARPTRRIYLTRTMDCSSRPPFFRTFTRWSGNAMKAMTKPVGHSTDNVVAALRGLGPDELLAAWTNLVKSLDKHAHAEAEALLQAADTMGMLALGDHIEKCSPGPMTIAWLLTLARAQQKSMSAARAAGMKNADARSYVADAWRARTDRGQSKASFGRMLAPEVKRRFDLNITSDRIARHWLSD